MRPILGLMLLFCVVGLVGCDGPVDVPQTTTDSVGGLIKPILERIAESGDFQGEGGEELKSYIEEDMAGVDAAKSQSLLQDYEQLSTLRGAAEVKAKAQEMLSKL